MKTIDKILFATDYSGASENACNYAILQAKQFNAKILVFHVINELEFPIQGIFPDHYVEDHKKEMAAAADRMMKEFCARNFKDFKNYETAIETGIPFKKIVKKAETEGVSLIVIGTHGRTGLEHVVVGSTAEKVVRNACCPVMTVRPC
ncbi:MAG: universal stress protein [Geobacteraceae bacterium]|nr:universal stress protein [Geobacteraceae bacterium]